MDKQFAVLGLGSFGSSVALTLENMGCDVLVVDESYEKVQEISDKVSYAVKADVSEPDALQALGGRNLDGVVVAISESLEASIMATMLCKEMGIPLVVAKAKDKLQGAILQRVGADRIVYPEIEMGSRVAKSLVSKEFVDWISLSNDYSMVEIVVPQNWVGKSLVDLGVRHVGTSCDCDVLLFTCSKVFCRNIYNTVGINIKCNLNLRNTTTCWRDSIQTELSERFVVFCELTLTLYYVDIYCCLVICCCREDLALLGRDCCISLDQTSCDTTHCLDGQ